MFSVPVLIIAVLGAAGLGVGIAIGGFGGILLGFLLAAAAVCGAVRLQNRSGPAAVTRFPGGAVAGVATVRSYDSVGATAHDEPMLRVRMSVSVPGRKPYDVTCYDVLSPYAANRLSTNAAFRCAVDPSAPDDMVVHWDQPVTLDGFSDPQNRLGVHTPVRTDASLSAAAVLATGLPAAARVVQSSSQGTVAPNGDPIMVFVLHVVPENGAPPFQSLTAQRVPPDSLSLTVAGTPLRVAYDPENRTRMVAIDWNAVTPGQPAHSPTEPPASPAAGTPSMAAAPGRTSVTYEEPAAGPQTGAAPFVVTSTPHASS